MGGPCRGDPPHRPDAGQPRGRLTVDEVGSARRYRGLSPQHPGGAEIDTSQFAAVFAGSIRSLLNWAEIADPRFWVEPTYNVSRDALGNLSTVWYASAGTPAEFHSGGATPLSVRDAATAQTWSADREARLAYLTEAFKAQAEPVQLVLAAIEAPDGRFVIVDGTHRACAAYRANADIRTLLFTVRGPTSASVLPDLVHYDRAAG